MQARRFTLLWCDVQVSGHRQAAGDQLQPAHVHPDLHGQRASYCETKTQVFATNAAADDQQRQPLIHNGRLVLEHTLDEQLADICKQLDSGGYKQSGHGILKRFDGS